jgi:hypothetical protein
MDASAELEAKAVGLPAWWSLLWVAACKAASSTVKGPPLSWHLEQVMVVVAALMVMSLLERVAVLVRSARVAP